MERAAHRPGLDQVATCQCRGDVAGTDRRAPDADREVGRGGDLRLDARQPPDDLGRRQVAHRVELVTAEPPRERLGPGDGDHSAGWRPGRLFTNSKPNRPLMQRWPSVTDESIGEVTLTIRSSWAWSVSAHPTPQYGQIVSVCVWADSSHVP